MFFGVYRVIFMSYKIEYGLVESSNGNTIIVKSMFGSTDEVSETNDLCS